MTERNDLTNASRIASSFTDFLLAERPELMPARVESPVSPMHATTVLALRFRDGVLMAGDRRATEGFTIASRDMEKVFETDSYSAVAVAGAAGPAMEMVRLFQTELEYYEKVEGEALSLAGKANHLGRLIRANLPSAMQGLVVVPLFGGFDIKRAEGRIYRYDVTGGTYEETDYNATGSGGVHARNTIKKRYTSAQEIDREAALRIGIEALADAAEEDAGTAGPDPVHGIYPTAFVITAAGVNEILKTEIQQVALAVLAERTEAGSS